MTHDPALGDVVALLEPAAIELDEAARALRDYQRRLDLDPAELKRVEERLAAIHDMARKHRVRPEALPALLAETEARLAALAESADAQALAQRAAQAEREYRDAAKELSKKRRFHANELAHRVTEAMQTLAMAGGRFEVALEPASHARKLRSRAGRVPRREPPEAGAGAARARRVRRRAVAHRARVVGRRERSGRGTDARLRRSRQRHRRRGRGDGRQAAAVARRAPPGAVRHAPAAGRGVRGQRTSASRSRAATDDVASDLAPLDAAERVEELARMLGGAEITAKTRAHAQELYEQHRRSVGRASRRPGLALAARGDELALDAPWRLAAGLGARLLQHAP